MAGFVAPRFPTPERRAPHAPHACPARDRGCDPRRRGGDAARPRRALGPRRSPRCWARGRRRASAGLADYLASRAGRRRPVTDVEPGCDGRGVLRADLLARDGAPGPSLRPELGARCRRPGLHRPADRLYLVRREGTGTEREAAIDATSWSSTRRSPAAPPASPSRSDDPHREGYRDHGDPAQESGGPAGYDAVVLGSGVRAGTWHEAARTWASCPCRAAQAMPVRTVHLPTRRTTGGTEKADEVRAYTDG